MLLSFVVLVVLVVYVSLVITHQLWGGGLNAD